MGKEKNVCGEHRHSGEDANNATYECVRMEYMRVEYDNLHSRIQTGETRINQELRDKVEQD